MELEAIQDYKGAEYPTLADYFQEEKGFTLPSVQLAAALAMLAILLGGCSNVS